MSSNRILLSRPAYTPPPVRRGTTLPLAAKKVEPDASAVDKALASFSTLSPAEKKELLDRMALAVNDDASTDGRELQSWAAAVADSLERVLRGGVSALLLRRLLGTRAAWASLEEVLATLRVEALTSVERTAVYRFLADLLVAHAVNVAEYTGAPLSAKFVANCVGQLPGIVESAFPGYARAGLLIAVVRRICQK